MTSLLSKSHSNKYVYQLKVAFEAWKSLFVSLKDRSQFIQLLILDNAGDNQALPPVYPYPSALQRDPMAEAPSQTFPELNPSSWQTGD